jgi:hypothetical protein
MNKKFLFKNLHQNFSLISSYQLYSLNKKLFRYLITKNMETLMQNKDSSVLMLCVIKLKFLIVQF